MSVVRSSPCHLTTALATLRKAVGDSTGQKLHDLANGRGPRSVVTATAEKSIGLLQ